MFLATVNGQINAVADRQAALIIENGISANTDGRGSYMVMRPDMTHVRLDFMGNSSIDDIHRQTGLFG